MADNRDQVAVAARLDPQNAEAILGVVVGDALDYPRQHLAVGWFGLDLHEPSHSVRGCPISGGNPVDSAGLNIVRRST